MNRSATENVLRVLYREARLHAYGSPQWYAVQPRIAVAVQVWRMDNTLRVVDTPNQQPL